CLADGDRLEADSAQDSGPDSRERRRRDSAAHPDQRACQQTRIQGRNEQDILTPARFRGGDPMTRDEIATLLARHQDAFLRRDADALTAQHAEKGAYESPAHGTVAGRGAINDLYRYWFTAFPDLKITWQPPFIDGDRAAVFWSFAGTAHGPFFGIVGAG